MYIYYFAYGANLSEKRLKERGVEFEAKYYGVLKDYELLFNKKSSKGEYSFANVVPSQGKIVEGYVYAMTQENLKRIDKAEGYPTHYDRMLLPIETSFKALYHTIDCHVYIANDNWIVENWKPTKEYASIILEQDKAFTKTYIDEIKKKSGL